MSDKPGYSVRTVANDWIITTEIASELDGLRETVLRQVINLRDAQILDALSDLGFLSPDEAKKLREQVAALEAESEEYAQLQSRCYEVFSSCSDGVFDFVKQQKEQIAALAEQNEKMRSKVYSATICHPNGVQYLLEEALALPDIATPALNRIKREGMLDAAEICKQIEAEKWQDFADKKLAVKTYGAVRCANEIYERADELYPEVKL